MDLSDLYRPIGYTEMNSDWKNIPLEENNEEMVSLVDLSNNRIFIESEYYKKGIPGSIQDCFVRSTIASMLIRASEALPSGSSFQIYDAWRPVKVQEFLFMDYVNELKKKYLNNTEHEILELAQKFVSIPSIDPVKPSPHFTGGAIDLTIVDESGSKINMESDFDSFCVETRTRHYEEKLEKGIKLSLAEINYCLNRRILYNIMTSVGFTNYPNEWWHFDYGNQFWGYVKKQKAFYGLISM